MAKLKTTDKNRSTGKPLQQITWSEKVANDFEYFKRTADYYIGSSGFQASDTDDISELDTLYNVYNNEFPSHWFEHITNPLSAKNQNYKKFPAKLRPVNILRTNVDQLVGEYNRRPFIYQVRNLGEDGYNQYTSGLSRALEKNLTEHFIAQFQREALANGIPFEEIPQKEEIPLPWEVKEKFQMSYKDSLALDGQRWLERAIGEYSLKRKWRQMFLDWLIGGRVVSYKGIENNEFIYERKDPRSVRFGKSDSTHFLEDGEWVVCREFLTVTDIVDRFYDDLKHKDLNRLEEGHYLSSPFAFQTRLFDIFGVTAGSGERIPVYHVQWVGRKKVRFIMEVQPDGELVENMIDEDDILQEGEKAETKWINEVYEVWRIHDDIYVNPRAVPVQRNSMNVFAECKLGYNSVQFSPTANGTFSLLKLGLPIQIMYTITTYILEKTIAKSKGKIVLLDKNIIPNQKGWDEEKFFYYSDALGFGLIDRNQKGVDKSFNQYQVLDLSLMGDIKELIGLQNYFRDQWDRAIGFTEARRGQMSASTQSGAQAQALFQSNVVTDLIFLGFEDFVECEMQGMIDFSKFVNVEGVKGLMNSSMFDLYLLNIDPIPYCSAEFGIILSRSPEEMEKLNLLKQALHPMIQNGMGPQAAIELMQAQSLTDLQSKLKKIEEIEQRVAQANSQAQAKADEEADRRAAAIETLKTELQIQVQEHKYQWEERLALLKGEMDMNEAALLSKDETVADVPDTQGIYDRMLKTMELSQKERMQSKELQQRERESVRKAETEKMKARTALKNKVTGEK